jgi:hypothetical protein
MLPVVAVMVSTDLSGTSFLHLWKDVVVGGM